MKWSRCATHLNDGVGVSDCATIAGVEEGHILGSGGNCTNAAQLVLGLLVGDAVDGEPSLDIIDQTEVLSGLLDLDNIHEAGGEFGVGPDLTVDLKTWQNLNNMSNHNFETDTAKISALKMSVFDLVLSGLVK